MGKSNRCTTDQQIAQAFFECLETEPIDKITVKNIMDNCGLNRQTFYYHFHDVYDLIRWILEREARRVVHAAADSKDVYQCIMTMLHAMDEKRTFFVALYRCSRGPQLRQDFMDSLARAQKDEFGSILREFGWGIEYADFIARINALVLTEFIERWHNGQSVNTLDSFAKWFSLFVIQQKRGAQSLAHEVRSRQAPDHS